MKKIIKLDYRSYSHDSYSVQMEQNWMLLFSSITAGPVSPGASSSDPGDAAGFGPGMVNWSTERRSELSQS